jgi:hypothetical protein
MSASVCRAADDVDAYKSEEIKHLSVYDIQAYFSSLPGVDIHSE